LNCRNCPSADGCNRRAAGAIGRERLDARIELVIRRNGSDRKRRDQGYQSGGNDTLKRLLRMPVAEVDRLWRFERGSAMIEGGSVMVVCRGVVVEVMVMVGVFRRLHLVTRDLVGMNMEVIATRVPVED
jgi:hypothetical protein